MNDTIRKIIKIITFGLVFCFLVCLGIYFVAETTWFEGSLAEEIFPRENQEVEEDRPVYTHHYDEDIVYSDEVPSSVADRGLILRGVLRSPYSYRYTERTSTKGEYAWIRDYTCDTNLNISSSDQEFMDFCDRFSSFDDPYYISHDGNDYYSCCISVQYGRDASETYFGQLFRTGLYNRDVSDGTVYMDGDPGCNVEIFFDPSGKYLLLLNNSYIGEQMDDFMLTFLEPEMVKLDILPLGSGASLSTEDPEVIGEFVDAIHGLQVLEVEDDMSHLYMAEEQTTFSFTDENGYVNDYTIVGEYLISRDVIYHIEEKNGLNFLMDTYARYAG